MLQWEELDAGATWPDVCYRAVGKSEYRISHDPEGEHIKFPEPQGKWILVVREMGNNDAETLTHYSPHRTDTAAKLAAQRWENG